MHSVKKWIILPFLALTAQVLAQDSFQQVENKSYQLYLDKNWKELADFGNVASHNGYDYYYLNVRTGRAFFELKDFENAKNYFEKALNNNSASAFTKEYLFWSYYNLEQTDKAQEIYHSLPDSIQKRMDYQPDRIIDYVYTEGGIKMSNNKNAADNLLYGRFSLNQQFSTHFGIYHQYTYMQQKAIWGEMKQHQYLFMPSVNLNKKWTISAALSYGNYQSQLNYIDSAKYQGGHKEYSSGGTDYIVDTTVTDHYLFEGNYKQNALLAQLNINKRVGSWSFTPHFNVYQTWENPNYTRIIDHVYDIREVVVFSPPPNFYKQSNTDTTGFNTSSTYQQLQYGLDLSVMISKGFTLGADVNYVYHSDFSDLTVTPYMQLKISKGFSLSAYYAKKGNYVLSLFEGTQLLNSFDELKHKLSLTGSVKLSSKFNLFTTFQNEKILDNLSLREYQFNSLFIGLKFRP